ncbi:MAG: helix-turn-helix domain-containing protein [Saprospiraceae bacterium]|nr:helix-turn-helix domain-containing protein [Saprospiraceae bacterium]
MIFLGGLGITLALIVLFFNQGNKLANLYLGLFLLCFNVFTLTHYTFLFLNSEYLIATLLILPFNSLIYVVGPFAYLYIRSILNDEAKFTKLDLLHFFPFFLNFIDNIPVFFSWEIKFKAASYIINNNWAELDSLLPYKLMTIKVNFTLRVIQLFFYVLLIWFLIISKKFKFYKGRANPNQLTVIKKWSIFFILLFSFLVINYVGIGIIFLKYTDKEVLTGNGIFLFYFVLLGLIILEIGLLLYPQILYGIPLYQQVHPVSQLSDADEIRITNSIKNNNSILSDEQLKLIELSLIQWLNSRKYLESDVTMITLATDVNIPIHHLAYYFNQLSEYKFIEWRNNLRIEYVEELIKNKQCQNKTVDTLGKECGFKSNSTFILNFKLRTGMLPSDFMKKYQ